MKHKKAGRKLSRVRSQRRALIRTLLGSLVLVEKITTTEAKAKEIRPIMDRMIGKAKKIKINETAKTAVIRELNNKMSAKAVKKLMGEFLNKFNERNSGYTRIIKLPARKSDSAKMAVIEFV